MTKCLLRDRPHDDEGDDLSRLHLADILRRRLLESYLLLAPHSVIMTLAAESVNLTSRRRPSASPQRIRTRRIEELPLPRSPSAQIAERPAKPTAMTFAAPRTRRTRPVCPSTMARYRSVPNAASLPCAASESRGGKKVGSDTRSVTRPSGRLRNSNLWPDTGRSTSVESDRAKLRIWLRSGKEARSAPSAIRTSRSRSGA